MAGPPRERVTSSSAPRWYAADYHHPPSTSGRRYLNRLKTYLSASAGGRSSVTVSPQSSSFSKKRSTLRRLPSYMGGLMSFKSSHTAASAALETMNAGREVDRGSHRPRPRTPTAATSISSMESLWLRRGSSMYAEPRCSRRTASMYASSSRRRRLRSAASRRTPRGGLMSNSSRSRSRSSPSPTSHSTFPLGTSSLSPP